MVCIANYDENNVVIGCTREDGAIGGLDFLASCEDLGFTITYKTQDELDILIENKRINNITSKANGIIDSSYSPLKQMKMVSYMIKLQDKRLDGIQLTTEEQTKYDAIKAADAWITKVRIIENGCQLDPAMPVDFSSVGVAPQL